MIDPGPANARGAARRSGPARFAAALRLRPDLFEELEHDPAALSQAALVVLAGGLGRGLGALRAEGLAGLVGSVVLAGVAWIAVAAVVYLVGVRLLRGSADLGEILRTTGFAAAPLVLLALLALPLGPLATPLALGLHAAALAALVVATRQALDVGTTRALWVVAGGLALALALLLALGVLGFGEALLFL